MKLEEEIERGLGSGLVWLWAETKREWLPIRQLPLRTLRVLGISWSVLIFSLVPLTAEDLAVSFVGFHFIVTRRQLQLLTILSIFHREDTYVQVSRGSPLAPPPCFPKCSLLTFCLGQLFVWTVFHQHSPRFLPRASPTRHFSPQVPLRPPVCSQSCSPSLARPPPRSATPSRATAACPFRPTSDS